MASKFSSLALAFLLLVPALARADAKAARPVRAFDVAIGDLAFRGLHFFSDTKCSFADSATSLRALGYAAGALRSTLAKYFPAREVDERLASTRLFIDDLSRNRGQHAALYLRDYPTGGESAIILGCELAERGHWPSTLAHELAHMLLEKRDVESWFEEGIAQAIEDEMGGPRPQAGLAKLAASDEIPALMSDKRPVENPLTYPLSFLLVRYLQERYPVPGLISAMIRSASQACPQRAFWARAVCHGQRALEEAEVPAKAARAFTEEGIFRFFAVALALNHAVHTQYSVSVWKGFAAWGTAADQELAPWQFRKLRLEDARAFINEEGFKKIGKIEAYRVLARRETFKIIPLHDLQAISAIERGWDEDFVLLVNPGYQKASPLWN